jgi:hypothetical protein
MTNPASPDPHERHSKHHDILLIRDDLGIGGTPGARLERFPVDKVTGRFKNDSGPFKQPVGLNDEGHRPTMNLGSLGTGSEEDPSRGPVLSALPLHPSPAASSASTCYLLNARNLNYTTPWTAEEWNDQPNGPDAAGYVGEDKFALLVASPAGKVYYLEKKQAVCAGKVMYEDDCFVFREVELRHESEIWGQLRNGCVVGRVMYEGKPGRTAREKIVPLVNIDSLNPRVNQEKSP